MPESDDWMCPYQIVGLGDESVKFAGGVDGMQALLLATHTLPAELASLSKAEKGQLSFLDLPQFGLLDGCRIAQHVPRQPPSATDKREGPVARKRHRRHR